jgi:hypothetical protein
MWLYDIWQKFKEFFLGTSKTAATQVSVAGKKKFTVRSRNENRRTGKRFEIKRERRVQTPPIQRKGKITITSQSRPRRCPRCGSKDTIIKAQGGNVKWECSETKTGCGLKW